MERDNKRKESATDGGFTRQPPKRYMDISWVSSDHAKLCDVNQPPAPGVAAQLRSKDPEAIIPTVMSILGMAAEMMASSKKKFAVAMDIDATVLLPDDRFRTQCGARHNTPIEKVFRQCVEYGIPVYFITAREDSKEGYEFAEQQLRCLNYGAHAGIFMRPKTTKTWPNISRFKQNCRVNIREKGYEVVLMIGDAWTDVMAVKNDEEISRLEKADNKKYWLFQCTAEPGITHWMLKLPA